ncbi:MAG: hypothetical protein JJU36_14485 [Phycisphaeraceae bacterium]|nr:hypothetical protein [Phycisphaeraceae bacterium]
MHPNGRFLSVSAIALSLLISMTIPVLADQDSTRNVEDDLRVRVLLGHALPRGDEQHASLSPSMLVNLRRQAGEWQRVWVSASNYNQHDHWGYLTRIDMEDDSMRFDLTVLVRGDGWHPGGRYLVSVAMDRQEDGRLVGKYRARWRDREIEGRAETLLVVTPEADMAPVGLRDRPRLLFRAEDLPTLRERADTPFGRLAMSKMGNSAAGSAFRYALTGDAALAADARRRVEALMADRTHGPDHAMSRFWAWRLEQAAISLDLCYDAWDESFRREVVEYLHEMGNLVLYHRGVLHRSLNWGHRGPHGPMLHWSVGVAGLAIAGEKGPAPVTPRRPYLLGESEGLLPPATDYRPGKGVNVFDFDSGTMPRGWIYVGAFPEADQPLSTHDQRGAIRPEVGQILGEGEHAAAWRPIADGKGLYSGRHTGNRTMLELTGPAGVVLRSNSYWYTVVRNDRPRWVRVQAGHGGVEMYLNGQRVANEEVVRLEAGLYPWLITGPIGVVNPWAKEFAEPRMIELTDEEAAQARRRMREQYEQQLADWRFDHDQWKRTGGADVRYLRLAEAGQHVMDTVFTEMLGEGGYMSGGRQMVAMDGPNRYAFIYRNVTGRTPGFRGEVADYIPRTMFVHPYRQDRQMIGQEVNGRPGFIAAWPDTGRDMAADHFATLLPLLRAEWRPAALWAWKYHTGASMDNEEGMRKILTAAPRSYSVTQPYGTFDTHPIYAFLNWPSDMRPVEPAQAMPLTWQAPEFGFYGFRNEWSGRDSQFITQFFAATRNQGAGTLRVAGLGHVWSHGLEDSTPERRFFENVVQLPGAGIMEQARGRVIHHEARADGSGAISLDLADVYATPVMDDNGRPIAPYEWYGDVRRPHAFGDSGIEGMRAMAVDYSGRSGAPCMIVLVDQVEGHEVPLWAWQLDSASEGIMQRDIDKTGPGREVFADEAFKKAANGQLLLTETQPFEDDRIQLHADGFTFRQGGASMRATFVAPQRPRIELAERVQYHRVNIEVIRREVARGVFVEGDGRFFVILTFQDGAAPAVRVLRGQGLESVVRVGDATVRYGAERDRILHTDAR